MKFKFATQSLVGASVISFLAYLLSAGLGYLREAFTANYFGTSSMMDTLVIAFTIPEFIAAVTFSCLPTAIIPALKKARNRQGDDVSSQFWSGFFNILLVFLLLALSVFVFRKPILLWLDSGISAEQMEIADRISKLFALFILFRGLESYFRGWLFERKHFIAPVSMGIIQNIIIIVILVIFYSRSGVEALAYGWFISSLALCLYNGIIAFKLIKPRFKIIFISPWIKALYTSLFFITIIEGMSMLNPIIDRYFAGNYLGDGHISALRYATALIFLPNRLFAIIISTASYPFISSLYDSGKIEKVRQIYFDGICILFFIVGFIGSYLVIFASDIIFVALQRGAFDQFSAKLTAGPLIVLASGLAFNSIYIYQMRFYYARSNFKSLGLIRLIMFIVKVVLCILLVCPLKLNGLALATVISWVLGFSMMSWGLRRLLKINTHQLVSSVLYNFIAILIILVFWIVFNYLWVDTTSILATIYKLLIVGFAGSICYGFLGFLFKLHGYRILEEIVRTRILNKIGS